MRFKNYESLSEQGLEAVPWTTAVEILASPSRGHVKKWDCLRLIGQSPPAQFQELQRKTYWTKSKGRRQHLTLSQEAFSTSMKREASSSTATVSLASSCRHR